MHTRAIVALSLGIGLLFLIIMALVSRLFVPWHSKTSTKQDIYPVDGNSGDLHQTRRGSSLWKQLLIPKHKDSNSKWVPTLSGIVKAGDEGLWSSAQFASPHGHPGEVSFEAICEMFANQLRPRSMTERSAYSGDIAKFINSSKRGVPSPRRVQSMAFTKTNTGRAAVASTQRKSLDLSAVERGLGRSLSVKRPAPVLVSMHSGLAEQDGTGAAQRAWMKDGRPADYYDGQMSVKLTPAEFAALSVLLGSSTSSPASNTKTSAASANKGAFGVSIVSTYTNNGKYMVSLRQHKRKIAQLPASGSGHSSLFAKHLACGSLPFSQDAKSVNSIMITDDVLEAVRSGTPLTTRKRSQQTPQTRFLTALPSSRTVTFHSIEVSTRSSPSVPLIDAIALLPFSGGLTPMASTAVIQTVQFVASGGVHPGRLLQRLEGLVDKVQRHSPHLNIFGPLHEPQNAGLLFRERERLGKVATGATTEALVDKVARVQRYITLLERLMALVPDMKPQEVLSAVQEAAKKELQRAYLDAVATHKSASASPSPLPTINDTHCPESDARSNRRGASSSSRPSARRSPRSSLDSGSGSNGTLDSTSGHRSTTPSKHNLGKQVETLLKTDLPFSIDAIAKIARLVLVAWTLSVDAVAWEHGEDGFRVPVLEELPASMMLV